MEIAGRIESDFSKPETDSLLAITLISPTFNNKAGSLNQLFNSGKINLIRNKKLKNSLIEWPGIIDDMKEEEIYADNIFRGPYYREMVKYVSMSDLISKLKSVSRLSNDIALPEMFGKQGTYQDYKALFNNREFTNHLTQRTIHLTITKAEVSSIIEKANEIIQTIDSEIEN